MMKTPFFPESVQIYAILFRLYVKHGMQFFDRRKFPDVLGRKGKTICKFKVTAFAR